MSELVPALKNTLFSSTHGVVGEYVELGIDALLESEALKGIPVVNTIAAICKTGYNLHERNLIKQTLTFISEFNSFLSGIRTYLPANFFLSISKYAGTLVFCSNASIIAG